MLDSITVKIVTEHNLFNPMFTARFFLKTWSKCTIKRTREVISGTYSHVILNLGLRIVHFKKEVEKRKEGSGWMKLSEARSLKFKGEIEVEWETWLQAVNGNAGSIPFPQCWLLKFYYSVNTLKNKHTKININIFAVWMVPNNSCKQGSLFVKVTEMAADEVTISHANTLFFIKLVFMSSFK